MSSVWQDSSQGIADRGLSNTFYFLCLSCVSLGFLWAVSQGPRGHKVRKGSFWIQAAYCVQRRRADEKARRSSGHPFNSERKFFPGGCKDTVYILTHRHHSSAVRQGSEPTFLKINKTSTDSCPKMAYFHLLLPISGKMEDKVTVWRMRGTLMSTFSLSQG